MASTYLTRNAILKGVSALYLMAFMSLYMQIPGLYGPAGLLPLQASPAGQSPSLPALLGLPGQLGLSTQLTMELFCLTGAALALTGVLLQLGRTCLVYAGMALLYGSLLQTDRVFLSHQSDTLLLEVGLLAALLAPLFPWQRSQPADALALFLLRWLLFRLTFGSGLMKLLSRCPSWWGLTALETLFEHHWLPTPVSWAAHQLPAAAQRAVLVAVFVTQLAVPVLFFAPVRRLRLFAFWAQVALQLGALLTGNCGLYHLLALLLCLALIDDDWLRGNKPAGGGIPGALSALVAFAVYGALLLGTVSLFELRLDYGGLAARPAFSKEQFEAFAQTALPGSVALAAAALLLTAAETLTSALMDSSGCCRALDAIWKSLLAVLVTAAVFSVTLVPYVSLVTVTDAALPSALREVAAPVQQARLTGQYGLYRQLVGAGGRSEVVLEGADSVNGPWKEIPFRYKPGDVSAIPAFAAPHQPRLDWQMAVAAAGRSADHPWLSTLVYRLLTAQTEVVSLLDAKKYPFADKPPKYVRALKYKYKFTAPQSGSSWWRRSMDRQDYLPVYTANSQSLLDQLASQGVLGQPIEQQQPDTALSALLQRLRSFFDHWDAARLLWALLLTCWALDLTRGRPWYY